METMVTLSFALPASIAQEVLAFVRDRTSKAATLEPMPQAPHSEAESSVVEFPVGPRLLPDLIDGKLKAAVELIVSKRGQFYNDELANELGVDLPLTSIYLGQLTKKLRKFGAKADGVRGENWYIKRRMSGRTLLVVRPEVLKLMREAVADLGSAN